MVHQLLATISDRILLSILYSPHSPVAELGEAKLLALVLHLRLDHFDHPHRTALPTDQLHLPDHAGVHVHTLTQHLPAAK